MAERRHYVVAYDISEDGRRTAVFETLLAWGDHAQYSVFFCELDGAELARLRGRLRSAIHEREDQILIVDLGPTSTPLASNIEVIGRGYEPPGRQIVI